MITLNGFLRKVLSGTVDISQLRFVRIKEDEHWMNYFPLRREVSLSPSTFDSFKVVPEDFTEEDYSQEWTCHTSAGDCELVGVYRTLRGVKVILGGGIDCGDDLDEDPE